MFTNFGFYVSLFEKIAFSIGGIIYLIFAGIVVKQVSTMIKNVNDKFNSVLLIFAYLHVALAIILIFLILTLL